MTLIVGVDLTLGKNKYLYMAGDKCGSNGFVKDLYVKSKIFRRNDLAFGYCGSFRMGQVLEYAKISKDLPDWEEESNIYTSFIDWAKTAMKDGGQLEENKGILTGGNFIFCNGKSLYEIQNDFSILVPEDGLLAVGSGEYHAKAVMRTYMALVKKELIKFDINLMIDLVYDTVGSLVTSVSKEHDVFDLIKTP
jgi:ATP-dependent protease HslVU (ClpYQ) peptidase subunit